MKSLFVNRNEINYTYIKIVMQVMMARQRSLSNATADPKHVYTFQSKKERKGKFCGQAIDEVVLKGT